MTPEQRQKSVMLFDDNTGELREASKIALATEFCDPAPDDQFVID